MDPQFVTKSAFTVVGLLIHTSPKNPNIPELWDRFGPRIHEVAYISEPYASYGLMDHVNFQLGQLDYMAGCEVTQAEALPVGLTRWQVPTNTYAVFETTLAKIGETFDAIYSNWLPTSGYQQAPGPYFERYGETFNPDDPTTAKLDIYIPVEEVRR